MHCCAQGTPGAVPPAEARARGHRWVGASALQHFHSNCAPAHSLAPPSPSPQALAQPPPADTPPQVFGLCVSRRDALRALLLLPPALGLPLENPAPARAIAAPVEEDVATRVFEVSAPPASATPAGLGPAPAGTGSAPYRPWPCRLQLTWQGQLLPLTICSFLSSFS